MTFTFTKFCEFQPTAFDQKGMGAEGFEDWLVMPIAHHRDSNTLEESNFTVMHESFEKIDPEEEHHHVHRFGHWANGWFEILVFDGSKKEIRERADALCELRELHIILDEGHWSALELEYGNCFEDSEESEEDSEEEDSNDDL
jgi:hypothetical protein